MIDDYLGYLADRNYSPKTVRVYGFDLVILGRWMLSEGLGIEDVTTPVLLRFLAACRAARLPGRPGPNYLPPNKPTNLTVDVDAHQYFPPISRDLRPRPSSGQPARGTAGNQPPTTDGAVNPRTEVGADAVMTLGW